MNPILAENTIENIPKFSLAQIWEFITDKGLNLGLKLLAAIVIYFAGGWIIKRIRKLVSKLLKRKKVEPSLATFLQSTISITLTLVLIVITINTLGINTTSLVALIGGAGLAIGMAMSGTLQNFAGGIMILLFKPFKVGDVIEAQGFTGTVTAIEITTTKITNASNTAIIIPNGALFNGVITNYTKLGKRRCEWKVSISYGDDVDVARQELLRIMNENPMVIKDDPETPQPAVVLESLADSSIIVSARAWAGGTDYWTVLYAVTEQIYKQLPSKGLHFPFPQMDVNIKAPVTDNPTQQKSHGNAIS